MKSKYKWKKQKLENSEQQHQTIRKHVHTIMGRKKRWYKHTSIVWGKTLCRLLVLPFTILNWTRRKKKVYFRIWFIVEAFVFAGFRFCCFLFSFIWNCCEFFCPSLPISSKEIDICFFGFIFFEKEISVHFEMRKLKNINFISYF